MTTTSQLKTWCTDHGYQLSHNFLPDLNYIKIAFWSAAAFLAYAVGRWGLPQVWADIKSIYAKIRNWFSGAKTITETAVSDIKTVA